MSVISTIIGNSVDSIRTVVDAGGSFLFPSNPILGNLIILGIVAYYLSHKVKESFTFIVMIAVLAILFIGSGTI